MSTDANLLVVSYTFPPEAEVGAQRIARFCRYLPEFGIRPLVLTVQERYYKRCDDSFVPSPGIRIERTRVSATPLDLYARWKARRLSAAAPAHGSGPSRGATTNVLQPGFLRRQLLTLLTTPDALWGWYLPAVQCGARLLRQERGAAIFSSGPPWISHLVARHLAKKFQRPWLADFRDPWWGNPARRDFPAWRKNVDHWLEASCVERASRVLCNTERLRQFFLMRYPRFPAEKFATLPNGFDNTGLRPPAARSPVRQRLALHLGDIYGERKIDSFCKAIGEAVRLGKLDPTSLKILFLGNISDEQAAAAQQLVPELLQSKCIEFHARVSWQQAQVALWGADLLLLFQGGFQMQVPAKFYEYLQTGKPIYAVTQEGALTDLLQTTGSGMWAAPEDMEGMTKNFLRALELPARSPEEVQQRWAGQYHFRGITAKLAKHVLEVTAGVAEHSSRISS